MQIRRLNSDILTVVPFEDRLIEIRLNRKNRDGFYKPVKGRVIRFERELLSSIVEILIHFDNEGRSENDSNRQPARKTA